ncbi:MAG: P-loop NTPase fold protein [Erysipelotrichaceae bacterium]|nr:P-loop NTPase fold protein [Erysipelotrichaceae bacterium]
MVKNHSWDSFKKEYILSSEEFNTLKQQYYFYDQANKVVNLSKDFSKKLEMLKLGTSNQSVMINTVISIIGDRGSGKSSFIKTITNLLKEEEFYVFDVVNPSIFDDQITILELFLSNIHQYLRENNEDSYYKNDSKSKTIRFELLDKLRGISKTLSNFRLSDDNFISSYTDFQILDDITDRTQLERIFEELIELFIVFLRLQGRQVKSLVVCIDDLDLVENRAVTKIVEHIQKYLSSKLIIIMAYREEQLFNSLLETNLSDNKELLGISVISLAEVRLQTERMINKVFPFSNCVFLSNGDIISKNVPTEIKNLIYTQKESSNKKLTNLEIIVELIEVKTGLMVLPIDDKEKVSGIFPSNLRGLIQWLEFLTTELDETSNSDFYEQVRLIGNNIDKYKQFMMSYCSSLIDNADYTLIKEWDFANASVKNSYIYSILFNRLKENITIYDFKEEYSYLLNPSEVQSYNFHLGDVFLILQVYKSANVGDIRSSRLSYFIKLFYSVFLFAKYIGHLGTIHNSQFNSPTLIENDSSFLSEYKKVTNSKIIPDNFVFLEKYSKTNPNELKIPNVYELFEMLRDTDYHYLAIEELRNIINDLLSKIIVFNSPARGYVFAGARKKVKLTHKSSEIDSFRYRNLFENEVYSEIFDARIDSKSNVQENRYYIIDPLSLLIKNGTAVYSEYGNQYIFYSLFDIDVFMRLNYSRRSEESPLYYLINRINRFIANQKENSISDKESFKLLSTSFLKNMESIGYDMLYTEKDLLAAKIIDIYMLSELSAFKKNISKTVEDNYFSKLNVLARNKNGYISIASNLLSSRKYSIGIVDMDELRFEISKIGKPRGRVSISQIKKLYLIIEKHNAFRIIDEYEK